MPSSPSAFQVDLNLYIIAMTIYMLELPSALQGTKLNIALWVQRLECDDARTDQESSHGS